MFKLRINIFLYVVDMDKFLLTRATYACLYFLVFSVMIMNYIYMNIITIKIKYTFYFSKKTQIGIYFY